MFSQDEIDAVLKDAQQAVDALASDIGGAGDPSGSATATASATMAAPEPTAAPVCDSGRVQRLLKICVPIRVRLAERSMPVNQIMQLGPGTILEFERTVDRELDLMINNCHVGSGVAVKVNEHFGLRVTRIGDLRERIESLGRM